MIAQKTQIYREKNCTCGFPGVGVGMVSDYKWG